MNKLIIAISPINIMEKKYIIKQMLSVFLGIEYDLRIDNNIKNYQLTFQNKTLYFDSLLLEQENYLKKTNIPCSIKNISLDNHDLVALYGKESLLVTSNSISCGLDIFASAYFMLSRFEEYLSSHFDQHQRFDGKYSIAAKYGFIKRPIVNEYCCFLWHLLKKMGFQGKIKKRTFKIIPTHDIDHPYYYQNFSWALKKVAQDIIRSKDISLAIETFIGFLKYKIKLGRDPYLTYSYLMDISEKYGLKSHFFVQVAANTVYDDKNININSKIYKELFAEIRKRNHKVGIHPSYLATDANTWKKEYFLLKKSYDQLEGTRQHYLRFQIPYFWNNFEEDIKYDSSLSYAQIPGFRAGTCYSFYPFDFLNKKEMKIKEKPLIFMENSYIFYQKYQPQKFLEDAINLAKTIKFYQGNFIFLWHNSNLNLGIFKKYKYLYEEIIRQSVNL